LSLGVRPQNSEAPARGPAQADQEGHAEQPGGGTTLAPALEHGRESKKEENNAGDADYFDPHKHLTPDRRLAPKAATGKDAGHGFA